MLEHHDVLWQVVTENDDIYEHISCEYWSLLYDIATARAIKGCPLGRDVIARRLEIVGHASPLSQAHRQFAVASDKGLEVTLLMCTPARLNPIQYVLRLRVLEGILEHQRIVA